MTEISKAHIAQMKKFLQDRQKELGNLMEAHEDEQNPVEPNKGDMGRLSRMDAMQIQAMAEETARRRDLELHRIGAALERIEEEEYGLCVSCGQAIPPKRLENDPATPTCVDCAGRAEQV